jgi:pimeloyl-ACP methyl ester carboxylesterase
MDIILVAGLWLPTSIWSDVCVELEKLGHRPLPVSLPGVDDASKMPSQNATLDDQLNQVLAVVDSATRPILVGHSAACTLVWMAADRRPDHIDSVALIGGFPSGHETAYAKFFPIVDGVMAFPGWGPFEGPDSDDLDDATKARVADDAIAVPEGVASGTVTYGSEQRFEVPVVAICPEFSPAQAKEWIEAGDVPELASTKHISFIDIDSGHWPMVTRPAELAKILDNIARNVPPWEPPAAGSEVEHLIGALDRQRATFRWKTDGLTGDELRITVGSSSLTLGGLLKHLAFVEDWYFGAKLRGELLDSIWNGDDPLVSAASDQPETLYDLWDAAVHRSRSRLSNALSEGGLDQLVTMGWTDGRLPSLRRMLCDLIEEYARHTGHADLLREAIDGLTGEDPPRRWQPTQHHNHDPQ